MFNFFKKSNAEVAAFQARMAQEQSLKTTLQMPVNDDFSEKYHQKYYRDDAEDQQA